MSNLMKAISSVNGSQVFVKDNASHFSYNIVLFGILHENSTSIFPSSTVNPDIFALF